MMKNLKTALFSMLAGAMMCACSSDNLGPEPDPTLTPDDGEGFFMALNIQMPDGSIGSRSTTDEGGVSSGGTEVGQEYENSVSSALIVLASAEDVNESLPKFGFIAASEVQNNRIADLNAPTSKQYRATARLQKTNLHWLYTQLPENAGEPLVYVFVFCNPTKNLIARFTTGYTDNNGEEVPKVNSGETSWLNEVCTVTQGSQTDPDFNVGIWGSNSFLMNNERLAIRALPANETAWENYNTAEKPFHLSDANENNDPDNSTNQNADRGSVRVERSVARFDFRDGSPLREEGKSETYNTYNVLYAAKADGTPNGETNPDGTPNPTPSPLIKVKLQKMCLVNMANSFYYIPRVSPLGQNTNPTYCGAEMPWGRNQNGDYVNGNYVVGPRAKMYRDETLEADFSSYFNFPYFEDNGEFNNEAVTSKTRWDVVSIDDVLKGQDDNYKGENNPKPGATAPGYAPGGYKIWRYVTENVIPSPESNQVNGISTGVVFRGRILPAVDTKDLTNALYPEEDWAKGNYENLLNCLSGQEFTYNGKKMKISGNSHTDPILYYYSGNLYMGWRVLRQAAIQAAITVNVTGDYEINRSNSLYKVVFGDGPIPPTNVYVDADGNRQPINDPRWNQEGEEAKYKASADYAWNEWNGEDKPVEDEGVVPPTLVAFRKAVTDAGVTIYQSAIEDNGTPGYYCYYNYWNRHNDNGIPGVMGPMEFDVVRNNVYKLSVDKISRLGHPRLPANDPDKPKPGTPDESDLIYLDVRVTIVPWAVRLNSIQF